MNPNEREHGYGDLREIVIEVMLEAGEHGMNDFAKLLEKTALALGKRDGLGAGRGRFSIGPAAQLPPGDSEVVVEIIWDLARQGTVTFDPNASEPGWPGFKRSRFGERGLRSSSPRFPGNTGFLKALRWEEGDISPDAAVYLKEAVAAFYMDCLLSTCVMLGVAAESEFLRLLSAAKNSKAHGGAFSPIGDGLNIGAKISQFKEAMKPIANRLPRSATDELDHNLDAMQSVIRTARRESGEPSGAPPPSRDQVYLYLQLFVPFARQVMRLRQELNESAYPRVVQLH